MENTYSGPIWQYGIPCRFNQDYSSSCLAITKDLIDADLYVFYYYDHVYPDIQSMPVWFQIGETNSYSPAKVRLTAKEDAPNFLIRYPQELYLPEESIIHNRIFSERKPITNCCDGLWSRWEESKTGKYFAENGYNFVLSIPIISDNTMIASINCTRKRYPFDDKDYRRSLNLNMFINNSLHPFYIQKNEEINIKDDSACITKENIKININSSTNEQLTTREQEVLLQLLRGYTYKEIGKLLYISENTVKKHAINIYRKLDIKSRTKLQLIVKIQNVNNN